MLNIWLRYASVQYFTITLRPTRILYFTAIPQRFVHLFRRYIIAVIAWPQLYSDGESYHGLLRVESAVIIYKWHRMHSYKRKIHIKQNLSFPPLNSTEKSIKEWNSNFEICYTSANGCSFFWPDKFKYANWRNTGS